MRVHRVQTRLVGRSMSTVAKNGTLRNKHQTVGAVHGTTRLAPKISAPKRGLAAEHRRNTALSHILTVTWRDARVKTQTTFRSRRGAGTQCGPSHPRMG